MSTIVVNRDVNSLASGMDAQNKPQLLGQYKLISPQSGLDPSAPIGHIRQRSIETYGARRYTSSQNLPRPDMFPLTILTLCNVPVLCIAHIQSEGEAQNTP